MSDLKRIVFLVSGNPSEGYTASAEDVSFALVTEADDLDELRRMIIEVVDLYFEDGASKPAEILWRFENSEKVA